MKHLIIALTLLVTAACASPTAPGTTPLAHAPAPAVVPVPTPVPVTGSWTETFGGALSPRWTVSEYAGGGFGTTNMLASNVDLSQGALALRLFHTDGGEVRSVDTYGFGTYSWTMRMSSTATTPDGPGDATSGETSAAFLFNAGHGTEIDFEQEGAFPNTMHCVTWHDGRVISVQDSAIGSSLYQGFHVWTIEWTSASITYLVDGHQAAVQMTDVPQTPANIFLEHWASTGNWGGNMTDQVKWMYVRSFSFVPAH